MARTRQRRSRRRRDRRTSGVIGAGRHIGRPHAGHAAHVVTRMRIGLRTGLRTSLRHGAHIVACMWVPGLRRHGTHVVTRMRVRSLRRHGAHVVAGVRIGLRRSRGLRLSRSLGRALGRAHVVPRMRVRGLRRHGAHVVTCMWVAYGGRRGLRRVLGGRVLTVILSRNRPCGGHQRQKTDREPDHAASPSRGRTVTTLNMPACMCISMWQWKAQSPGASAVRSKVTLEPGATLTVCFNG